jgi:hypothetical protein
MSEPIHNRVHEEAVASGPVTRKKNVVPDAPDLRDRMYSPPVTFVPVQVLAPQGVTPVLNQRATNACTGFALASVIYHLQSKAKRPTQDCAVSPFMLYSMARRYDEFPGDPDADTGSSLRGAMKGWFKHGACGASLWTTMSVPPPAKNPADNWRRDAVRRPLGAYYRIETSAITDMQVALNETGAIYASAACHSGWEEAPDQGEFVDGLWVIPHRKATPADGGHAFAIIGYNQQGFIIQNSWDTNWGSNGRAVLTYGDWLDNAMDCWVAQLGVITEIDVRIAGTVSLRVKEGKVHLASDARLRNREIDPFIVDMENNGKLSNTGDFRTSRHDLDALLTDHLGRARQIWNLGPGDPVDIAIYAHGGLTSEEGAANTAAQWIPALYEAKIFPIFFMWETDLLSTLRNRVQDLLTVEPRSTGAFLDTVKNWWNQRLEKLLSVPGSLVWGEMKQNADAISKEPDSGAVLLYEACKASPFLRDSSQVRLHLIGHSAGAILHSYIVDRLPWNFESISFMAPAVTCRLYEKTVLAALRQGRVKSYNHFQLSDDIEQRDRTCESILGYSRSLLYLVSQSFEKGVTTPILGMERYFRETVTGADLNNVQVFNAPGPDSKSTTHGGFDEDTVTRNKVVNAIHARAAMYSPVGV